jgi:hypothetical protein
MIHSLQNRGVIMPDPKQTPDAGAEFKTKAPPQADREALSAMRDRLNATRKEGEPRLVFQGGGLGDGVEII